ncbi:85/88 kDa calcium-independent phospholipase A2, partial [Dermatophagoides pteronyssinus]
YSALEPYSVVEVKIEDYNHYDIMAREETLILYSYCNNKNQQQYEMLLHRENSTLRTAFSLYRSIKSDEAQIYFLRLKDKLPIFVNRFPNILSISSLQELCKYINMNPTQNMAHICSNFGYIDYFRQLPNEYKDNIQKINELLNQQDKNDGKTCLQIAIEQQRLNILQAIFAIPNVEINFTLVDNFGNNLLHIAAQQSNGQIVSLLCQTIRMNLSNDILMEIINAKNRENFAPLYLACSNDKPACVKELLKNGADVNGASIQDNNNNNNDGKQGRDSLSSSSTPTSRDESPSSDNMNNDRLINMLNVNDMKNGGTPLHWCKSSEVIEMLVERNCNLNARNFHGDTALHHMVARSDLNCTISLLGHGADVNASGANGNTPLHVSIKANNTTIVQALIVFGAQVDLKNSSGHTARHLAATSQQSPAKDTILYILHSVCARRCSSTTSSTTKNCNEGCGQGFHYNGVPPDNPFIRNQPLFDRILLGDVVKNNLEQNLHSDMDIDKDNTVDGDNNDEKNSSQPKRKKIKLLSMDGGGIRGLILIQILCHLELVTGKRIIDLFDWIAGTSTGGILALLLTTGYSAKQCRNIYFLLKDKLFIRYRPYCSDTFEKFLQKYLGLERRMNEFDRPKLLIPATIVDNFPPTAKFFRNYPSSSDLLNDKKSDDDNDADNNELLWKVARATGAAPTYFSQFESYLDGGLIANNPTMDLLHEIQFHNRSTEFFDKKCDNIYDIDLVVSIGTGLIPSKPIDKLNFSPLFSFSGLSNFATNFPNLIKVLVEQASLANGRVVDRAQSWCSMINVPFFRLNPAISEDIQMDESDNIKLINMLWETMAYIYMNNDDMSSLISFLLNEQ